MKLKPFVVALLAAAFAGAASAVTIFSPMSLSQQFIVGIHDGQEANSNIATETLIAQAILNLSLGQDLGPYHANDVFDYSGTITINGGQHSDPTVGDGTVSIPAGWGGALAKYDGPNGGYVLFVFGGQASTIPEFPYDFWTSETDKYRISHFTLFSGTGGITPTPTGVVPEGGAGVALLGSLLLGMAGVRKLISKAPVAN